jgi:hypothetical protein
VRADIIPVSSPRQKGELDDSASRSGLARRMCSSTEPKSMPRSVHHRATALSAMPSAPPKLSSEELNTIAVPRLFGVRSATVFSNVTQAIPAANVARPNEPATMTGGNGSR